MWASVHVFVRRCAVGFARWVASCVAGLKRLAGEVVEHEGAFGVTVDGVAALVWVVRLACSSLVSCRSFLLVFGVALFVLCCGSAACGGSLVGRRHKAEASVVHA